MSIFDELEQKTVEARAELETDTKGLEDIKEGLSAIFVGGDTSSYKKTTNYLRAARGWVYSCVNAIAEECAAVQLKLMKLKKGGETEEVETHPALDVLYKANNATTRFDLIHLIFNYLELAGSAPLFVAFEKSQPSQLILLRPDRLTIKAGQAGELIGGYTYRVQTDKGIQEVSLEPNEVVPLRYPDPDNPLRGFPPLRAAARSVDIDEYSEEWNKTFFKNSANPAAALESDKTLSKDVRARVEKKIEKIYSGVTNAHKTIILESGLKWKPMSITQKDMDFIAQQTFSRDKILAIFRVPRTVIGITDDVNRANAETTDYVFARRTIRPKLIRLVEQLTEFYLPLFAGTEDMYFDFDDPVPKNLDLYSQVADRGVKGGYITVNEGRELIGLESIDGGDDLRNPQTFNPITGASLKHSKPKAPRSVRQGIGSRVAKKVKQERQKKVIEKTVASTLTSIIYDHLKKKSVSKERREQVLQAPLFTGTDAEKDAIKVDFLAKQIRVGDVNEMEMRERLDKVFNQQRNRVIRKLDSNKGMKTKIRKDDYLLNESAEVQIYIKNLDPVLVNVIKEQSKLAFALLKMHDQLTRRNEQVADYLDSREFRFADEITKETNRMLGDALSEGISKQESIPQLRKRVEELFDGMKKYRSERIARSEIVRASGFATEAAYKQSGVVIAKEWLAYIDDRTDDACAEMNGKKMPLGRNFFNKGDSFEGVSFDYESIKHPPLHVNCRCTLIPVVV